MTREFLLFLGCTVPVRNLNYELSSRVTARALGITLNDHEDFQCCGFPMKGVDQEDSLALAARNLALAGQRGLEVCVLCNSCGGMLTEAAHALDHDDALRGRINARLAAVGLEYKSGVRARHFLRVLVEEKGYEAIRAAVKRPLTGWKFAPHYGCHYLKPTSVTGRFDDPVNPHSIKELIRATGAESIDYPGLTDCCGGSVLGMSQEIANAMAANKLATLAGMDVDAMVLNCPFCNVMFEGQQKKISKEAGLDLKLPILYYPQILGLALGFAPDDLGFKLNRIKAKKLIQAMAESAA
jgi:heterodisulfide reductase subunit B